MLFNKAAGVSRYPRTTAALRFAACRAPRRERNGNSALGRRPGFTGNQVVQPSARVDQPDASAAPPGRQRLLTVRSPRIHRLMSSCAVIAISAAISEAFS